MRRFVQESRMNDEIDARLLGILQKDAHVTAELLGAALNLSPSQAGRRRQRLEAEGVIRAYVARLDPAAIGLTVQAFIQVQMASQTPDAARGFARLIESQPEIIAAWTLTGEADYLLRVYCEDLGALNRLVHQILLPDPAVARVQSQIVMDRLKEDAPLPT